MNHMDNGGMTAWRLAVGIPAYDMLFAMVEAGADFNKKDAIGQCLLDLISSRSEFYVVGDEQKLWFRRLSSFLELRARSLRCAARANRADIGLSHPSC